MLESGGQQAPSAGPAESGERIEGRGHKIPTPTPLPPCDSELFPRSPSRGGEVSEVGKSYMHRQSHPAKGSFHSAVARAGCSAAVLARLRVSTRQLFSLPLLFSGLHWLTHKGHTALLPIEDTHELCCVSAHFLFSLAKLLGKLHCTCFLGAGCL